MKRLSIQNQMLFFIIIFIFILLTIIDIHSQSFKVKGNISTSTGPVKFASALFLEDNDSSKMHSVITDSSGNFQFEEVITDVKSGNNNLPGKFEVAQNYPNPFSTTTTISYNLGDKSEVNIKIYNILGQEIKSLRSVSQSRGIYGITWDGTNNFGKKVTPGIYFYQINAGSESKTKKMLFGFNSTKCGGANLSAGSFEAKCKSQNDNLKKAAYNLLQNKNYTIYIQNNDSTKPLIYPIQYCVALTLHDTTLNLLARNFDFSLCYIEQDSITYGRQICLNNILGTNRKAISSPASDYSTPSWSPDGKYIVLWLSSGLNLYDVFNDKLISLSSAAAGSLPLIWTSDSKKIIYPHGINGDPVGAYSIDIDGLNFRQLKYPIEYLYSDNYNTLYTTLTSNYGQLLYHSNLDGSVNEFITDLAQYQTRKNGGVGIADYDPNSNTLLLAFDDPSTALPNFIGKYNIDTRRFDTVAVPDISWKYYKPKYSSDYKKIAIEEVYTGQDTLYSNLIRISLFENGTKTTVVEFQDPNIFLEFSPFAFSKDDKYIAFGKNILLPGQFVSWISYLCIVDLNTKQINLIGSGTTPVWNPRMRY